MKTEHERLENIRMSEHLRKSQEMRDVMVTFENEAKRLNDVIAMKDRMLESLTYENVKNKEDLLEITTNYESQVNALSYHRNELSQQVDDHLCKIAELQSIAEGEGSDRAQ